MIKGGFLSYVTWLVCFALSADTCSSSEGVAGIDSFSDADVSIESPSHSDIYSYLDTVGAPLVFIDGEEPFVDDDHSYLNTVDWQLRQLLDLSTSKVITKANSIADLIEIRYYCDDRALGEEPDKHQPEDGKLEVSVDTDCATIFSVHLKAIGDDATVEYRYEIDIALLNSFGI